ncbi:MAG: DNA polymerase I [Planctomycetaceae bacterium]|nr:DNA polymerase I [Planctomycetaceae bacterium]
MQGKRRQQRLAGFEDDTQVPSTEGGQAAAGGPNAGSPLRSATSLEGALEGALEGKSVYALDAHSLIYQVFHALPEMSGPAGQPVGAIYGFLRDVLEILERRKPDYLLCAFDAPGPTFRHALYEPYKAQRSEMPQDLQLQIPNIMRFLAAMAIPVLSVAGYEADDVLATVARRTERLGGDCYLVTNDKDCRQLINDRIKLYNIRKGQVIDAAAVETQWGIRPDQVVDFQAMWGDATDNVPGIPGIGQKTAAQLLAQYDTLEGILAHVRELPRPKQRESIEGARELVLVSRQLVRLDDDVPLDIDWSAAHVGGMDVQAVWDLCAEFGFQTLPQRLTGLTVSGAPARWTTQYETVATPEQLAALVSTLSQQTRIAIDTETTSTHARAARLVGCSFAWQPGRAVYVPMRAPAGEPRLDAAQALTALRPILEDPQIAKVGQNLKYDLIVLRNAGLQLRGVAFDTMVADYLLAPGERSHTMDDLAKRYLNHDTIKIRDLIGTGKSQRQMDEVPVALVTDYAAQDADVPWRLAQILEERLSQEGLDQLFYTLEMPLVEVLAEMEYHGIRIDVPLLARLSQQAAQRLAMLEEEIHAAAGTRFNIDSPRQLARILFDDLGLRVVKRTRTGPSTDADVLSQLASEHPLPAKIIEYRQQAKLKSTYIDALPQLVHPETGRVHTSFKQDVAATGRLSSTDPNLQNIPVRTREGREIRAAFVPGEPGWKLLCADYSQIELRVLAHFSQDAALLRAFAEDRDIHAQVASQVNNVPLSQVTPDQRRAAKAINFGIIYGQSAFGLAAALAIEKDEAAVFIDRYFNEYPGVEVFLNQVLADCWKNGYVTTALGRRRAIQGVRDPAKRAGTRQRTMPERIAINTVIQGTAADLIKQAMTQVYHRLRRDQLRARMLLQIHDELVFEVPADELDQLSQLVVQEMTGVGRLSVPLRVDIKAGANWADCEPLG